MHTFLQVLKRCLKDKLFLAAGRASRPEFWYFTLFAVVVRVALYPLNMISPSGLSYALGMVYAVINFVIFVAHYTVLVRRLHDTNRSALQVGPVFVGLLLIMLGFFMMVPLAVTVGEVITGIGLIYVLVLCALPGNAGSNLYGDPQPLPSKEKVTFSAVPTPKTTAVKKGKKR